GDAARNGLLRRHQGGVGRAEAGRGRSGGGGGRARSRASLPGEPRPRRDRLPGQGGRARRADRGVRPNRQADHHGAAYRRRVRGRPRTSDQGPGTNDPVRLVRHGPRVPRRRRPVFAGFLRRKIRRSGDGRRGSRAPDWIPWPLVIRLSSAPEASMPPDLMVREFLTALAGWLLIVLLLVACVRWIPSRTTVIYRPYGYRPDVWFRLRPEWLEAERRAEALLRDV